MNLFGHDRRNIDSHLIIFVTYSDLRRTNSVKWPHSNPQCVANMLDNHKMNEIQVRVGEERVGEHEKDGEEGAGRGEVDGRRGVGQGEEG